MLTAMFGHLTAAQEDMSSLYKVGQNTSRLLLALGDLVTAWLLVRQSEVALAALSGAVSEKDRSFYEGKLAATRFFTSQILPRLSSDRVIVENTDNALMEVDEAAFCTSEAPPAAFPPREAAVAVSLTASRAWCPRAQDRRSDHDR